MRTASTNPLNPVPMARAKAVPAAMLVTTPDAAQYNRSNGPGTIPTLHLTKMEQPFATYTSTCKRVKSASPEQIPTATLVDTLIGSTTLVPVFHWTTIPRTSVDAAATL